MNQDELRTEILSLVAEYTENRLENKQFIAGETYIRASGESFDKREFELLTRVVLDGWITEGIYSSEFAKNLRLVLDNKVRHIVLTNSGSSANLLAVSAIAQREFGKRQAKPGDEIITPAVGFPTTVSPIIQNGLIPVFVDVNFPNYAPDPVTIEHAITERTKGIIIAHTLGNPFEVEKIRDICDDYNLWMIEDCADGLGSRYNGEPIGTFGDISTTSFFPAHHVTTGQGGAVFTDSPMVKKVLDSLRAWGRDCFPAGTKIWASGLIKNIEDVVVGDAVISHTGHLRRVTELTGKTDSKFISIKARCMKNVISTDNHPYYIDDGRSRDFVEAKNIKIGNYLLEALPKTLDETPKEFSYSYDLQTETKHESIKIEPDLMRLVGYWLAEGSLASGLKGKSGYTENKYKFYRVDFSFNVKESQTIDDVCFLMNKYFGVTGYARKDKRSNGVSLSFKTRKGWEFFGTFFGKGASNKHLPYNMECWDLSCGLSELIRGFWFGDGSSSTQGFSLCSTSETLINQIRRILLRFHVVGSFFERDTDQHITSTRNGIEIKAKHILHSLSFYGEYAERFGIIIEEEFVQNNKRGNGVLFNDEYVLYPVERIESFETDTDIPVYNFEVEVDNSYHVEGIAVHNCYCLPGKDNTCGQRYKHNMGTLPFGYDHKYIFSRLGYNLQITDMQSALGLAQLEKLPEFEKKRKHNWQRLHDGLQKYENFFIIPEPTKNSDPSWFGFALTLQKLCPFTRNEIVQYLEAHKIATRMLFGGNLLQHPAFMDSEHIVFGKLDNSRVITDFSFWIGVYPGINDLMIDYILETFDTFLSPYIRKKKHA